jgi:hypothetical protein
MNESRFNKSALAAYLGRQVRGLRSIAGVKRQRVIRHDNENARRRDQIERGFLTPSSRGVVDVHE